MRTTIKSKYEALVKDVNSYVQALRELKMTTALMYKATEQTYAEHNNPNGQKQFNIVEVRTLITHVITARQLGYETLLTATDNELTVNFKEKHPRVPIGMTYCK